MKRTIPLVLLAMGTLSAQSLVVDGRPGSPAKTQRIELAAGGFLGDFFRIGAQGEVWTIDSIRLWFAPAQGTACGSSPGDSIERLTLLGALDNPPVPGRPVCDCHARASPPKTASCARRLRACAMVDTRSFGRMFTTRATPRARSRAHRWK